MEPDALDRKLTHTFAGRIVRKDLLHQGKPIECQSEQALPCIERPNWITSV